MIMQDNEKKPALRFKGFTDPWEQRKLGEICDFITKGATPTTYGFSWQPDGVPFFRNDSIKDNVFVFGEFSYISEAANEVLKRSEVHGNDILIAITGDIGKVGIIPDTVEKANINQHIARVRIRKEALPYFVYQYLASDDTQKEYQKIKTGLSMPQLSLEQVRDIVVKIPEFNEQGKIADCLRRIDTLITLHQRKHEKLVNIKKSMLDKMFPQNGVSVPEIRFKGFTDPWEQRKLGEICDFITKGATPTTYGFSWQPDGVPFFRNDSIKDNVFVFGEFSYISEAANEVLKRSEVHGNDILIAITGDIGKVGIIPDTVEKANINQHIARVRIRKEALPYFVYQYLASDDTQKEYQKIKTGLSMPQLSLEQVRDIVVKIPEFNEQGKIADCLRRIDTLITLHQRKLEKLQNIKKSCLEKMFV